MSESVRQGDMIRSPVKKRKRESLSIPTPPRTNDRNKRQRNVLRDPFMPNDDNAVKMDVDMASSSSPEPQQDAGGKSASSFWGASSSSSSRASSMRGKNHHVDRDRIIVSNNGDDSSQEHQFIDRLKTLSRRLPFTLPPSPTKTVKIAPEPVHEDEEDADNPFLTKKGEIKTPKQVQKPDRMTYVFRGKKVTYDVPFDALLAPADDDDPFPAPKPRLLFPTPTSPVDTPRTSLKAIPKTPERGQGRSRLEETKRRMNDMMAMGLPTPAQEDAR